MMEIQTFSTERLHLKLLTPQVYHHYFTTCSDDEIKSFFQIGDETLIGEKERFEQGSYASFKNLHWFQLILKESNEIVGYCGFHTWHKQHSRAEIGYNLINDSFKQKGMMSEAVAFVINYGFDTMKLNRIEAFVGPKNIPSLKIMQKFGFEKEGYCKEHYCKNGITEDSVLFALLTKDYVKNA